tara:strand:- start:4108 stop:5454 length:1347 start_codon:yes stop_codon:yes gene_type:complete
MHCVAVFRVDGDLLAVLSLFYVPIRFLAWTILSIEKRLAGSVMQCCGDLGFFGWIAIYPQGMESLGYSPRIIGASMLIGAGVLLVHAVITLFFKGDTIRHNTTQAYWPSLKKQHLLLMFVGLWLVAFTFAMISHTTGIAAMGVEVKSNAVLPFRLAGVLAFSRIYAVPMFALLFVDIFSERKMPVMFVLTVFCFVCFSLFEAYIRLSRGVVITNMIYLFFWAIYRGKLNFRLLFSAVGVVSVMAVAYPYISRLRGLLGSSGGSIGDGLRDLINQQYLFGRMETGFIDSLYAVIIRGFTEGLVMCKFIQHLDFDIFTHHLDLVKPFGNSSMYHTRVIDGMGEGLAHSSGITLYTDSLFLGGLAFVLVTAAIFSWISYLIDARKLGPFTANPALQASLCFFFFTTFVGGIISKVFLREPMVVLVLLCVWGGMYFLSRFLGGVPKGIPLRR